MALSTALLFADPASDCLSNLGQEQDDWRDAVVLATPFWLPRARKLNKQVNLEEGISPLVAASIRFDPDRELSVAPDGFSPTAASEATKATLSIARRVRVLSTFPASSLTDLLQLMPSLTAVHLATAEQLTTAKVALASLEGLQELRVTNCRDLVDLSAVAGLPALRTLSLGGCVSLKDASALAAMKNLRELSLRGCPEDGEIESAVLALKLTTRELIPAERDPWGYDAQTVPDEVPVEMLDSCICSLRSDDPEENMQGTLMIRKMLSVEDNPFNIEVLVVENGCVPLFVAQLLRDEHPQLQFESAWALCNIASAGSDYVQHILSIADAVPNLARLLGSPNEDCREQAAWAIGNLAGEDAESRDVCLDSGALSKLIAVVTGANANQSTARNAGFALSNLCRGKPLPKHDQVAPALPVFAEMLRHEDRELVVEAAWALSYLTDDSDDDRIESVLDTRCLPRLVELLTASSSEIIIPTISIIGNIVTGNDRQTQAVLDAGALSTFHYLIHHPKCSIRKEVCWALSNISAGSEEQIQAVMNANLFPALMNATKATEWDVKKEAVFAIVNAAKGGSVSQISYLVQSGVLSSCLRDLLADPDTAILSSALDAIGCILEVGERNRVENHLESNEWADEIIECGGKDLIEELLNHDDTAIQSNAASALERFGQRVAKFVSALAYRSN